jgi:hypothetical protein
MPARDCEVELQRDLAGVLHCPACGWRHTDTEVER